MQGAMIKIMYIYKIFYIKTFKIAPTCFDPQDHLQGATLFLAKVTFLKTFTDYFLY
jgi:hypothetical protein